ncbi:MAG: alpha/beta hydrolase [Chitinophagaceae bacterium]|nr:alpha/beta hydrolase [Chitinophagaceae bacterium]
MKKTISYANGELSYEVHGDGPAVFLIHGFGEDSQIWDDVYPALTPSSKIFIPDLPGSGLSTAVKDMSMEGLADAMRSILEAEKIATAVLIGHSMGGYITLAFAEKYPEMLTAFGLFHSSAFADSEEKKTARNKSIEFIKENGAAKFIEQSTPKLFSDDFKKNNPEKVAELIALYTNFSPDSLVSYYEAMMKRPDRTEILKTFKGPILFIMGQHDSAIPLKDSLQQCHLPKFSFTHLLDQSGHMGMIEETDLSNQFIQKFLKEAAIVGQP